MSFAEMRPKVWTAFLGTLVALNLIAVGLALWAFQTSGASLFDVEQYLVIGVMLLVFPVYSLGLLTGLAFFRSAKKDYHVVAEDTEPKELLHWFDNIERRGIGDAIQRINHIAIIVADVGRSLAFYTEVMGFQQIRRPNFDRHGAWLTVGNTELHLIKGAPCVHDGEDLIVSHIALDAERPLEVLEKLIDMNIPFRQNVSVPDPLKSSNNREEDFSTADGKVTQFFIRDPDGYYLEICNCDILTKFCLMKEEKLRQAMTSWDTLYYREGLPFRLGIGYCAKIVVTMKRTKKRVRANLRKGYAAMLEKEMIGVSRADEVDMEKLRTLEKRKKTYCDIIQGFSSEEIEEALLMSGNSVPIAVLILKTHRGDVRPATPPSYFCPDNDESIEHVKDSLQPRRFYVEVVRPHSQGSDGLARACKPFNDRKPSKEHARLYAKPGTPNSFHERVGSKVKDVLGRADSFIEPRKGSKASTDTTRSDIVEIDNIMPGVPVDHEKGDNDSDHFDIDYAIGKLESEFLTEEQEHDEKDPLSPKLPTKRKEKR